eukprot:760226-Hanusia_phi.AAC.14
MGQRSDSACQTFTESATPLLFRQNSKQQPVFLSPPPAKRVCMLLPKSSPRSLVGIFHKKVHACMQSSIDEARQQVKGITIDEVDRSLNEQLESLVHNVADVASISCFLGELTDRGPGIGGHHKQRCQTILTALYEKEH